MTNAVKSLPQVLEEVELLAEWLTQKLKVEPTIVQMKKLDIVSGLYPEYNSLLTSAKQQIANLAPQANVGLTPTQIASKLNEQTGTKTSSRDSKSGFERTRLAEKGNDQPRLLALATD